MTRHARLLDTLLIASTCLTAAYGSAAYNGLIPYNRLVMVLLMLPVVLRAIYMLVMWLMRGFL